MSGWWEGVKRMLGIQMTRHSPPNPGQMEIDRKRQEDQREREDAKQRLQALDVRVDVLSRRIGRHERKPH